jgi:hypothetical protein
MITSQLSTKTKNWPSRSRSMSLLSKWALLTRPERPPRSVQIQKTKKSTGVGIIGIYMGIIIPSVIIQMPFLGPRLFFDKHSHGKSQ